MKNRYEQQTIQEFVEWRKRYRKRGYWIILAFYIAAGILACVEHHFKATPKWPTGIMYYQEGKKYDSRNDSGLTPERRFGTSGKL